MPQAVTTSVQSRHAAESAQAGVRAVCLGDAALLRRCLASAGGGDVAAPEVLLRRFGGLGRLLSASPTELARAGAGHLAPALAALQAFAVRLAEVPLSEEAPDVLECWEDVLRYLRTEFAGARRERALALFLDTGNRLLAAEDVAAGSAARVDLAPRPISERALELGASKVILAHNHVTGSPRPSAEDRVATGAIATGLVVLEIELVDHVIVSPEGTWSMVRQGELA